MPPFAERLSQREIAAVASYVRQAWGNEASAVSELDVLAVR
jgi:mono/diheme cytochrome c family protein